MFEDLAITQKNDVIGINDIKIKKTISQIYDNADLLREKLAKLDEIMSSAEDYIICDASKNMFGKFRNFRTNFAIVLSNVYNYGDDLTRVLNNFKHTDVIASDYLRSHSKGGM